jgi:phytoene dehydrogenase-like protein
MTYPVGVVGGGLGGLAAACTLAARGHKVVLWEKNDWLGGKAAVLEQDGFRFDMGPTILTVPRVLHRIFAEAGRSTSDMLDLRRLDPQWRCFFDDGSVLDLTEDDAAMAQRLAAFAPGSQNGYRDFIGMSARLHEVSEKFFFWRSVEGITDAEGCAGAAHGHHGSRANTQAHRRQARGADAGSFCAICGQFAVRLAGRSVRYRTYADQ